MDATLSVLFGVVFLIGVYSVPPDVCFHQFRWEDCGAPPKAVIYYYKSGSRCEVGIWRGCLPNLNMFADEYECVQTCIFSLRAKASDFHSFQANMIDSGENSMQDAESDIESTTDVGGTDDTDTTGGDEETGATGEGEHATEPAAEGGNAAAEPEGEPAAEPEGN